jgi:hypothetical protein
MFPLWQRGMKGDFKDICLFIIHKISPCPSFPKRGIMGLDQKTVYSQTLNRKIFPVSGGSKMGIRRLTEAIILQSIEDLGNELL